MTTPLLYASQTLAQCCNSSSHGNDNKDNKDPLEGFVIVKKLGQGHMSSVFLAVERTSMKAFAVKVKQKRLLQRRDAMHMDFVEKDILSCLDHPFLPSLINHFESQNHTFLAIEYCSGGDINVFRNAQPKSVLSVSALRFYAAELVLALEHLHEKGIVYRDLKPQNILVRQNGHIMLTDFDLSLRLDTETTNPNNNKNSNSNSSTSSDNDDEEEDQEEDFLEQRSSSRRSSGAMSRSHTVVGTEEYMAPEVLWCSGHAYAVDWWSLGIILFEMAYGRTPFGGATRKDTFVNIMSKDLEFPSSGNPLLNDLIRRLLVKEPCLRLGSVAGAQEVKKHPFFQGLCWNGLQYVSRPPFVPEPEPDATFLDLDLQPDFISFF